VQSQRENQQKKAINKKKKALKKIKGVALGVTGFVIISLLKSTCVRTKSK